MDYYPFGAEFCDNNTKNFVQNHKYNGKEFDHMHGLNTYDYGARQYNPVTGRWDRMDPHCESYKDVSPYVYCHNNPVNAIDPDGKDVLLVIWATNNRRIGHAGVAISNYTEKRIKENGQWTTKMVPDGTYTYRDLWPGGEDGVGKNNYDQDVSASYHKYNVTYKDILNKDITEAEGIVADGVVKIATDFNTDQNVQNALDSYESKHPNYNAFTNNCSDYAEVALETVAGKQLAVDEKISSKVTATTPNQLYKASKTIKNKPVTVLVNPKEKVNNGFIHGAIDNPLKEWKAYRMLDK